MLIRPVVLLLGWALFFAAVSIEASAQAFPDRNIKLVVGLPAGGATDLQARVLADKLSTVLGQRVLVENRPGANGAIASRGVAKAEADGYTLAFNGNDFPINLHGMKEPGYSLDEFSVVGGFSYSPMVLIVSTASSPQGVRRLCKGESGQADLRDIRLAKPGQSCGKPFQGPCWN